MTDQKYKAFTFELHQGMHIGIFKIKINLFFLQLYVFFLAQPNKEKWHNTGAFINLRT